MQQYQLSDICNEIKVEYQLHGDGRDISINKLSTPDAADENALIFISPNRQDKKDLLARTRACAIICDDSLQSISLKNKCLIIVKDPKLVFAMLGNLFFIKKQNNEIHPTAIIHHEAVLSKDVSVGPNTYIGKSVIGKNSVIHGNVYIHDNVSIGDNVIINAGCVIGADGLGHIRNSDGCYVSFPHVGGVIIESGVEIGANSCVAKGALSNTVIRRNTIIDTFVQIGHNVLIDENVLILANSVIGGSSIVKNNVVIAIGAHICDYVTIGENAHVGPGVVIMKDLQAFAKAMPKMPIIMEQKVLEIS